MSKTETAVPTVVSICMITYNHSRFIAEAIEGVMKQKTSFPIQLVIGEDSSPDGTRAICEKYAAQYPDKILLLPSDKRYGVYENFFRTLKTCNGKYVAVCDGDDYWTDDNKLQVQADFMDQHPEIATCSHLLQVINENGDMVKEIGDGHNDKRFTFKDCVMKRLGGTASMFFRRSMLPVPKLMDALGGKSYLIDWPLELFLLDNGGGYYMARNMGVYRKHGAGITSVKVHTLPVNTVKNRIHIVQGLRRNINSANKTYLNSLLGILLLKMARISTEDRNKNLLHGSAFLVRAPFFLFNISKVADRFNPFR